jgi:hypothetical protein
MDSGLRPSLDFGRCCHDRVPDLDEVLEGEALASSAILLVSTVVCGVGAVVSDLSTTLDVLEADFSGEIERARSEYNQQVSASRRFLV